MRISSQTSKNSTRNSRLARLGTLVIAGRMAAIVTLAIVSKVSAARTVAIVEGMAATVEGMAATEEAMATEVVTTTARTIIQAHMAAAMALAATITAPPLRLQQRLSLLLRHHHHRQGLQPLVRIMQPSTRNTMVLVLLVQTRTLRTGAMLREFLITGLSSFYNAHY